MRVVTAALAIAIEVIVLLGYFFAAPALTLLRLILTDWAVIIGAVAVLVGIFNLVAVHLEKIRTRQKGSIYGALLVLSLFGTFVFGILFGAENPFLQMAVDAVIVPVEAALMALLAVTLIYASIRLLRQRQDLTSVLFLLVALLVLVAIMPTPFGPIPGDRFILYVAGILSNGGARGLLIGIALGALLTGLRIMFGVDRPYGGN
jgi:hypothetical protein